MRKQTPPLVHERPCGPDQKLTPTKNTQLIQADPAYCAVAQSTYDRPTTQNENAESTKVILDHKAQPGTPGFHMADQVYQDLFAHVVAVAPDDIKKLYLKMANERPIEMSWVLRKFYAVS